MAKRRRKHKKKTRSSEARGPSPAPAKPPRRPKRIAVPVTVGVLLMVAVVLVALLWPRHQRGLPAQLSPGAAAGFNVMLITLDTTRADHLGCYGYDRAETPVLDALATEGVRFADAVTPVPITLPSHTTMLTGLDPPNHGVRHNAEFMLDEEYVTLAEVLRGQGYETAAFTSAFVLDARFGLDQGFDHYDDSVETSMYDTFAKDINERPAGAVTDAAIRWLERRDRKRPFFSWVHYFDPHRPFEAPPTYAARFPDQPYDAEIAYMDAEIGRLVRALEAGGLRDHTLIVVAGDHGEGMGDHGEITHARLIYESVMHVPLFISCPGLFRDRYVVDDVVVSLTDIFPTVLDLLGVEEIPETDGRSLLAARDDPDRIVYMECLATYLGNGWAPLYGLRRHYDKHILAPRPEYYDLRNDPGELANLFDKASGRAKAARDLLQTELEERLARWPSLAGVVASAQTLDPEALQRLESLGYVGTVSGDGTEEGLADPKDMVEVMQAIDQANALARAGNREEALVVIRRAVALSPHDPRAMEIMGKILLYSGREAEAEKAFRDCIALRPNPNVCLLLAQILIKDGRRDEASKVLDQGLELDPRHGGIHIARGDLLALEKQPHEALASYRRAIDVDPYRATGAARARIKGVEEIIRRFGTP